MGGFKLEFVSISQVHCKPKPCKAYRELPVSQFSQGKNFITGNPVLIAGILF